MNQQTMRKTFKYTLIPTPELKRALERVLGLCRRLYNVALEQRITAWQRRQVSVSRYEQEAELKEIRAAFPAYAALHSHLPQDVLARLDTTYKALFRRMQRGRAGGHSPLQARDALHPLHRQGVWQRAAFGRWYLVLAKIGRLAVRWSRPLEGGLRRSP
jgi:putative transposase